MTRTQKIQLRQAELRQKLGALLDVPAETRSETHESDTAKITNELRSLEGELAAAILAEPEPTTIETRNDDDPEARELRTLRARVEFGDYVQAALSMRSVDGAPRELNAALGIAENRFPLEMLVNMERRALRDGDANANQGSWLDRLLDGTAAERLGITFSPVAAGVAAFPVVSAGGSPNQRGRTQAEAESTYTVAVTELKPSRAAIHGIYSIEDDARLPGLAGAIVRDMNAAMGEGIDKKIFKGDNGANENGADITGLQTAAIDETTLTQANKVQHDKVLEAFLAYVDGMHAGSLADVRVGGVGRLKHPMGVHFPGDESPGQPGRNPPARWPDVGRPWRYRDQQRGGRLRRLRGSLAWHRGRGSGRGLERWGAHSRHVQQREQGRDHAHAKLPVEFRAPPDGQLQARQVRRLGAGRGHRNARGIRRANRAARKGIARYSRGVSPTAQPRLSPALGASVKSGLDVARSSTRSRRRTARFISW